MSDTNQIDSEKGKGIPAIRISTRGLATVLSLLLWIAFSPERTDSQVAADRAGAGPFDSTSFAWDSKMSTQTRRAAVEQYKRLNEQRQRDLAQDSIRLIAMTSKLKEDVDDGSRARISPATLKKVVEIEKLAHEVQEKMKIVYSR